MTTRCNQFRIHSDGVLVNDPKQEILADLAAL